MNLIDWNDCQTIYANNYADSPCLLRLPSGSLFCAITVNTAQEGSSNTHLVGMKSNDDGNTWHSTGQISPAGSRLMAWGGCWLANNIMYCIMLLNEPHGSEIYYSDSLSDKLGRPDVLGVMRICFSKDEGVSWKATGWYLYPKTAIDYRNFSNGLHRLFWMSGKPLVDNDRVLIPFNKLGQTLKNNFFADTESFIINAPKYFSVMDDPTISITNPIRANRPEINVGVQEEPSIIKLDNGYYGVFRTDLGYVGEFYYDGQTVSDIGYAKESTGKQVYAPRAKNEIFNFGNGRYLLWHHNNTGEKHKFNHLHRHTVSFRRGVINAGKMVWSEQIGGVFNPNMLLPSISYPSAELSLDGSTILLVASDKRNIKLVRIPISDIW